MQMNYSQSKEWLFSQKIAMKGFTLAKIRKLIKLAKINTNSFKTIHVAGSNGKGSTCAFIAQILKEEGCKTGLYTSPHLVEPTERITINGTKISEKKFAKYTNYFRKLMQKKKMGANFFEIITAMAFKYFDDEKIEFLVAETGMGGRLDATNVLDGIVNVITTISLEHTQYLGKTITKIAKEKAGIIKNNSSTIAAKNNKGFEIIEKTARVKKSELVVPKFEIISSSQNGQEFLLKNNHELGKLKIKMLGSYQCENACLAATAMLSLRKKGFFVSNGAIRKGLLKTKWKGRLEIIKTKPIILFDSAHNPEGWKKLFKALKLFSYKKLFVVFAAMNDKDLNYVKVKLKKANLVFLTRIDSERAENPKNLRKKIGFGEIIEKPAEAVKTAVKEAGKNDLVLVAGSIYLAGEAYSALGKKI
ncbi:MAG TPA: folylpolyglutamate synthase/dihydrofolate synthase family protein [archaeon]|nr:folylpolyglutamate synthase/dihydrofolate synthase family protein [archaeon]